MYEINLYYIVVEYLVICIFLFVSIFIYLVYEFSKRNVFLWLGFCFCKLNIFFWGKYMFWYFLYFENKLDIKFIYYNVKFNELYFF